MAQYLSDLHKVPLQVLPFYARVTATLSQQYADIGTAVGAAVARKVRGLAKKVDATHKTAEPRTASARYLAELAKFRVVDPGARLPIATPTCPPHPPRPPFPAALQAALLGGLANSSPWLSL